MSQDFDNNFYTQKDGDEMSLQHEPIFEVIQSKGRTMRKSKQKKKQENVPLFVTKDKKDEQVLDIYVKDYKTTTSNKANSKKPQQSIDSIARKPTDLFQRDTDKQDLPQINLKPQSTGTKQTGNNIQYNDEMIESIANKWKNVGIQQNQINMQLFGEPKMEKENQVEFYVKKIYELQLNQQKEEDEAQQVGVINVDNLYVNDEGIEKIYQRLKARDKEDEKKEVRKKKQAAQQEQMYRQNEEIEKKRDKFEDKEKDEISKLGQQSLVYGNLISLNIEDMQNDQEYEMSCYLNISSEPSLKNASEKAPPKSLFRIIPQAQYRAQEDLRKKLLSKDYEPKDIKQMYDSLMAECDANKTFQTQMMPTEVKYRQDVQIIHEETKRFLCAQIVDDEKIIQSYDPAFFSETFYMKAAFSYESGSQTHFKLVPSCSFQQKGTGIISSGHCFYIVYTHKTKDLYLYNYNESKENDQPASIDKQIILNPFIFTENLRTPFKFKTQRDSNTLDEAISLQNTSIVRLSMANENMFVSYKSQKEILDMRKENLKFDATSKENLNKNIQDQEQVVLEAYEKINSIDLKGYWIVEHDANVQLTISLKSFLNPNLYLTYNQSDKKFYLQLAAKKDEKHIEQKFLIKAINQFASEISQINNSYVFQLQSVAESKPMYIQAIDDEEQIKQSENKNQYFTQQDKQDIKYLRLGSKSNFNQTDTFTFLLPDNQDIREINFCYSTINALKKIIENTQSLIQKKQIVNKDTIQIELTAQLFQDLLYYLTNQKIGMIQKQKTEGVAIAQRQKLLIRLKLIDHILNYLDLLQNLKNEHEENKSNVQQKSSFLENSQLILRQTADKEGAQERIMKGNTKKSQDPYQQLQQEDKLDGEDKSELNQWTQYVQGLTKLESKSKNQQLLPIIFNLLFNLTIKQRPQKEVVKKALELIKSYSFVESAPQVILNYLQEDQKLYVSREIHQSLDVTKIYQFEKYKDILDYLIIRIKENDENVFNNHIYLMRKLCVQKGYPLPLVQNYILDKFIKDVEKVSQFDKIKLYYNLFVDKVSLGTQNEPSKFFWKNSPPKQSFQYTLTIQNKELVEVINYQDTDIVKSQTNDKNQQPSEKPELKNQKKGNSEQQKSENQNKVPLNKSNNNSDIKLIVEPKQIKIQVKQYQKFLDLLGDLCIGKNTKVYEFLKAQKQFAFKNLLIAAEFQKVPNKCKQQLFLILQQEQHFLIY